MNTIQVHASRQYDVFFGKNILKDLGGHIRSLFSPETRIAVVTDDTVNRLYGDALERALDGIDFVKFVFPAGESSKSISTYSALLEFLAQHQLTRTDAILAFGGGVVGDLAGFAAATYLRGIPFIQVPTTLLAAVDSSVGGKTAVDLAAGKNLCGAFWQPHLVLCDYTLLDTLSDEIFADGMAEVIKYGVIRNAALFQRLHQPVRPDPEDVIAACVAIKRDVVEADERDSGVRALLNFGHTAAHGIELCSDYQISHGRAVAVGMVIASRGACKLGLCQEDIADRLCELLALHQLPTRCDFSPRQLAQAALSDKKRAGDTITLILPEEMGLCVPYKIPVSHLEDFFWAGMESE